ncbi:MAG: HAD-IA family hydrolase [Sphaerochaetaceae bacterium]|nr:HAD-IA family hydrolase [Sphaerochaetaceae bacterium]
MIMISKEDQDYCLVMEMAIKLFVFDMGNVLIEERHVWPAVFRKFGIDVKNIRDLGPNATSAIQRMLVSDMDEQEFWNMVELDMQKCVEWKGILSDSYTCMELPGTRAVIGQLLANGNRVVCGTNNIRPFYEKIKAGGYYDTFQRTYSSFKIGLSKPDPEFWKYIADKEGVRLDEMFFTDDLSRNIEAAKSLGIKTHLFTNAECLANALNDIPTMDT